MLKESGSRSSVGRWHSAPAARNTAPILAVLERVLPSRGRVLELASGTGQHVVAFARAFPALQWHPSDMDADLRRSVELHCAEAALTNIATPLALDVLEQPWPIDAIDALVCINMIHVAPWPATDALFAGASQLLPRDGVAVLYGPYMRNGQHTAPSNVEFDTSLRARDPNWGLRDIDDVVAVAKHYGIMLAEIVPMPANNFSLVFRYQSLARQ
jgi:hypothetical protein